MEKISKLLEIVKKLREEDDWCKRMTPVQALDKFHEEVREVDTAIKFQSSKAQCKELGDVLFHVVFQAEMAKDFNFDDVVEAISEKMTYRHLEPNKVDEAFLRGVELALGVELFSDQKRYLLGEPTSPTWEFRQTGKTYAYCIKLALSNGSPLDMTFIHRHSDRPSREASYARGYFRKMFLDVWYKLKNAGIKVRELKNLGGMK